jgi:hypothetical protein
MADPSPAPERRPESAAASESSSDRADVLPVQILAQPDDETCGPTCLHAVYRYWGESLSLEEVVESTRSLSVAEAGRGTLAVMLGIHALSRGYRATLYTFNLHVFDPTWFGVDCCATPEFLIEKLRAQADSKSVDDPRFQVATDSYLEFLERGGSICFRDLTSRLIAAFIRDRLPVLTGVSATYLYRCSREYGPNDDYDDIRGEAAGHFVVLHGYDPRSRLVTIADPLEDNPGFESQRYTVSMDRLVPAIMLGVMTYDANLLVIEPAGRRRSGRGRR